jgi:NADH:ubiquinone oxidoreductase subunit
MTIGTWLFTKMRGALVGSDAEGNRYFQDKRVIAGRRRKRWVIYNGIAEASRVPADWHGWLHYTTDAAPPAGGRRITNPTIPAPAMPIARRAIL